MNLKEVMHAIGYYKTKPKSPPNLRDADCCSTCQFSEVNYRSVKCELFPEVFLLVEDICDKYIRRVEE